MYISQTLLLIYSKFSCSAIYVLYYIFHQFSQELYAAFN